MADEKKVKAPIDLKSVGAIRHAGVGIMIHPTKYELIIGFFNKEGTLEDYVPLKLDTADDFGEKFLGAYNELVTRYNKDHGKAKENGRVITPDKGIITLEG